VTALVNVLDALARSGKAASVPAKTLADAASRIRLLEAREGYLASYGDPFSQRVVRGELDQHILGTGASARTHPENHHA